MKKLVLIVAVLVAAAWAGSANAAVGISMEFDGSFRPAVGINLQPSGWVLDLLASFGSVEKTYTQFGVGARLDKMMDAEADVTGLWGLCADVLITSPEVGDSYNDIAVGAYIGGNAHVGSDRFHLVGHTGVKVNLSGARVSGGDSSTNFGTFANLMFRWTGVFGS